MKRTLLTFAALAVTLCASAGSRLASEEWVKSYVAANAGSAGSVGTLTPSGTWYRAENGVSIFYENKTEFAVSVARQTDLSALFGYTNGMIFARVADEQRFRHGDLSIWFNATNYYCVASNVTYTSGLHDGRMWLMNVDGGTTNLFFQMGWGYIGPTLEKMILDGRYP